MRHTLTPCFNDAWKNNIHSEIEKVKKILFAHDKYFAEDKLLTALLS